MRVLFSAPPRLRLPGRPPASHKPEDAGDNLGRQAVRTAITPDPATMPNLVAAPAWRIAIRRQGRSAGALRVPRSPLARDVLTFSATIWNAGPAPFTIEGFRRPHSDVMDAYEYFFDPAENVVGRARAGTLRYDPRRGHDHWHLRHLATYELVGRSRIIASQKQSFCIAPTDPVDLTMPGAQAAQVALGFGGTVCDLFQPGAIWVREQLPAGWGDTYTQVVAGQAFDITHVPNGSYKLVVRVNPLGVLHETSTADDVAVRRIRLSGRPGARRVVVAPWHGISG
jgi:lysyl oxidase